VDCRAEAGRWRIQQRIEDTHGERGRLVSDDYVGRVWECRSPGRRCEPDSTTSRRRQRWFGCIVALAAVVPFAAVATFAAVDSLAAVALTECGE
jgi:hypothetical protein